MIVACLPRETRQTAFVIDGEVEEGFVLTVVDDDPDDGITELELESEMGD